MSNAFKCVCGKICTSLAGLTLHQKSCDKAQEATNSGQPNTIIDEDAPRDFDPRVSEIVALANEMAVDADRCLKETNKSAGKRARKKCLEMRNKIKDMRQTLLDAMKTKSDD